MIGRHRVYPPQEVERAPPQLDPVKIGARALSIAPSPRTCSSAP